MTYLYWCTCVRTYFRQFVVSFKNFQNYVLFYQEPEPDKKIPGAGAAPKLAGSETMLIYMFQCFLYNL